MNHTHPVCNDWCRIHVDANYGNHERYPRSMNVRSGEGWARVTVHIGPGAFFPYRPTPPQWAAMRAVCPHTQMDLTCNNCLRHTFHPFAFQRVS